MKTRIFTLVMGIMAFCQLNAQTVIFDPATFSGDLAAGMEIVDIDGVSYLQVVVDGWNSTLNIPAVSDIQGTKIEGMVKYSQGSTTIDAGLTLENISSVVQMMDTVNKVPASWDANTLVPAATSLTQNPSLEGWSLRGALITEEMQLIHQIQFFGQQTTDWNPAVGDTMWVGKLASINFDPTVMFDPANVDPASLPAGMEIVEEAGEKLLKVKLNGWESNLPITAFDMGENNHWSFKAKYEAGTSGVDNANAQIFVQAIDEAALFNATANPAPADLTEIEGDAKAGTVVKSLQLAAQETSGDWPAVVDGYMYLSKISVSFIEAQPVDAPNTSVVAISDDASSITIDGLYDDAYGEVANVVERVASNETGGDISPENSYGEWLAVCDNDNFYFYIEVNDNDPIELGESTSPWMNDGIELFLDIQNRRYLGGARIAGEQHQFRINYGTEGPAKADFGMDAFFGDNDTTNIEFAIISSSSGYVIEARIPWATWYRTNSNTSQDALAAVDITDGMKVAFEVSILDADVVDGRKSILNWANDSGEDKAYLSNEYFGEITLGGSSAIANNKAVAKELTVYPNPASNQINIEMENAANIQIYNLVGSQVINIDMNGESVINISSLQEGMYILKATNTNGEVAVAKFNKK